MLNLCDQTGLDRYGSKFDAWDRIRKLYGNSPKMEYVPHSCRGCGGWHIERNMRPGVLRTRP